MNPFEKLSSELKRLQTGYREESFYRPLCDFLESYAGGKEYLHMLNIAATSNPGSESLGEGVGFPDIEVRQNRRLIGYIEVKSPTQNLDSLSFSAQFNRYKESLENVVFTNFKKWTLYSWDQDGKPQKTSEAAWDFETDILSEQLKKLLTVFFEGQSYQAKTPHQLALALARKTKLLSQQVEDALTTDKPERRLVDLKKTFEKTLIQDITGHQFANIYAETIAYSLFLAKLEHFEKGSSVDFTLRTAVDYLPKSVPIFRDLYQLTGGTVEPITPEIHNATEILIEQLNFADIEKIYRKLVEHKPGEDPVIQFYEPFLSEYDPKEREARGVYYTPKPIVDYIVRSVDHILKTQFNKPKGLGDESVQILDPATGTGTFLMSAIQTIYADIEKKNKPLGEQAVQREFNDVVSNHILKHIYGFELLVAPYAVAHLKLTLELERLGFNFSMTEKDQDKENDRLKIYLANTLDDPDQPPQSLFGFDSITEESEKARLLKKEAPILVITGNPPYSGISQNPVEKIIYVKGKKKVVKTWIGDLIEDYKYTEGDRVTGKHFHEKKHWLGDDYVKFIRFGQWKIDQNGEGVLAFITNHSYLNNPTFMGMRWQLMNSFDEIHILNLHGSTNETVTPTGEKDENVFPIQKGVAITLFIKKSQKSDELQIFYADLWGTKRKKFDKLSTHIFTSFDSQKLRPKAPYYFFIPRSVDLTQEYEKYWKITDVFPTNVTGIVTARDDFIIDFQKDTLLHRIEEFCDQSNPDAFVRSKYFGNKRESNKYLSGDTRGWKMTEARKQIVDEKHIQNIENILYRPFDVRFIYYHPKMVDWGREDVMPSFIKMKNLGLITARSNKSDFMNHFFVTKDISEAKTGESTTQSMSFPLYRSKFLNQNLSLLEDKGESSANISPKVIKELSEKLGLTFIFKGEGDLVKSFGPEDVFYYAYAVFHSPTYRNRYHEDLKTDFPRLPITTNKQLFKALVSYGRTLVNLHLLGKNPFDRSKTIFDNTSKWHLKVGGEKPVDLDDWKISDIKDRYDKKTKRIYVNTGQYFEGIEKEVWEFMIGGYQVLDKWLKDRKKAGRVLSPEDTIHYMKIVVSLRETSQIMKEIDKAIPKWPIS